MLKRIRPEQVRLGMFLEAIDGAWLGQPFWRSRFLLDRPEDVETLKSSGVKGVIINTDEGVDVVAIPRKKVSADSRAISKAQVARALKTIEEAKPLIKEIFEDARMGSNVSVSHATQAVEVISACMLDSARALVQVSRLKTRDEYTFLHSIAVTALMVHLGRWIKADEETIMTLGMGGLMHDVGKVKIPLSVLNKVGRLTDMEMVLVRRHPADGYALLSRQANIPQIVLDICLHHHERPDGRGYPQGLFGDQISLPVRIASICDVYDALTSKRAYKKAWTPVDAAKFMLKQEGQFDRPLLRQFFNSLSL